MGLVDNPCFVILIAIIAMSVCVPKTVVSLTLGAMYGTVGGTLALAVIAAAAASIDFGVGLW
ncbi:MAG: hypothetical protein AAF664_25320, partial [Planctomycetota bacterium]